MNTSRVSNLIATCSLATANHHIRHSASAQPCFVAGKLESGEMELTPKHVMIIFASIQVLTASLYYFAVPETLSNAEDQKVGVWGTPDGEFNWCELDYLTSDKIAEPVNTATGTAFSITAFFLEWHHMRIGLPPEMHFFCISLFFLGCGTVAFHATLRYTAQLMDEIPMFWIILIGTYLLSKSIKGHGRAGGVKQLVFSVFGATGTSALFLTTRHSMMHEICRGVFVMTFAICLVYIFWGSAVLLHDSRDVIAKQPQHKGQLRPHQTYTIAMLSLLLAMVFWAVDILFCPLLHRLPWGLPYPHLHTVWHLLSCLGVHFLFVTLLWIEKQLNTKGAEKRIYSIQRVFHIFPVVVEVQKQK